jgi:alpha-1,3-mannosyltransferase
LGNVVLLFHFFCSKPIVGHLHLPKMVKTTFRAAKLSRAAAREKRRAGGAQDVVLSVVKAMFEGSDQGRMLNIFSRVYSARSVAFDVCCAIAFLWELLAHIVLFWKASFTHIDWKAYMEQVGTVWRDSQFDYAQIKGDTGPVAYPAGFIYIYTVFYHVTSGGLDLNAARILFSVLYLLNLMIVFRIYKAVVVGSVATTEKDKPASRIQTSTAAFPPAAILLLCFSKRIHSIYSLRLFNDTVEVLFAKLSMLLFAKRQWNWGVVLLSVAVSVKMNAILLLPAVAVILLVHQGLLRSVVSAAIFICMQVLIGLPFLLTNPSSYLGISFNFGRVFKNKWSVNFKWVPCEPLDQELQLEDCSGLFTSREFSAILLVITLTLWLFFFHFKWTRKIEVVCSGSNEVSRVWSPGGPSLISYSLRSFLKELSGGKESLVSLSISTQEIILMLFTSNFIGVVCSKSLHFQFYVWYFHSLPLLLWERTSLPLHIKIALLVLIELCWNPWEGESSSIESSALLTGCHILFLLALCIGQRDNVQIQRQDVKED